MTQSFDRLVFVIKTRVRIALANRDVENAFTQPQGIDKRIVVSVAFALLFLTLAGVAFNKSFLIGESTASLSSSIPVVEDTVKQGASATVSSEAESLSALEAITVPSELVKPEPEKELERMLPPIRQPLPEAYVIAVDKSSQKLLVLRERHDYFEVVEEYVVSLGSIMGTKELEGDMKTPEGFYKVTKIKHDDELPNIYGPQAFVLNYPNRHDRKKRRTGGGIWIHGTGIGERTPDTRGCVELSDKNIVALGQWVKIDTAIAIFSASQPLPVINGKVEKQYIGERFFYGDALSPSSG